MLVATKLDCAATYNGTRFIVLVGDDGRFYAVRDKPPFFCFEATSRKQAIVTARRAIEFHNEQSNKAT